MKPTGEIRRVVQGGRISLPPRARDEHKINPGDEVIIYITDNNQVAIKKVLEDDLYVSIEKFLGVVESNRQRIGEAAAGKVGEILTEIKKNL